MTTPDYICDAFGAIAFAPIPQVMQREPHRANLSAVYALYDKPLPRGPIAAHVANCINAGNGDKWHACKGSQRYADSGICAALKGHVCDSVDYYSMRIRTAHADCLATAIRLLATAQGDQS
jgi:hypothetical protein